MIDKVELLVGGQVIDDPRCRLHSAISPPTSSTARPVLAKSVARRPLQRRNRCGPLPLRFYPLRFSFCENWQTALPFLSWLSNTTMWSFASRWKVLMPQWTARSAVWSATPTMSTWTRRSVSCSLVSP